MLTWITLPLLTGIIIGLSSATLTLWLIKVNCPKCKKLRPLKEVIIWHWKPRTITGQPCQKCQKPKSQIEITL